MPVMEGDTGVLSVGSSRSEVPVGRPDGSGFQAAGLELSRGVSRARRGRGGDSGRWHLGARGKRRGAWGGERPGQRPELARPWREQRTDTRRDWRGRGAHPSGLLASTGRQASFCQIWVFSQRPSVVTRGSNEDWLCLRHSAVPGISRPAEAPALARKGFLSPTSPGILWEGRQKGEVRSVSSRRSQVGR